MNLRPATSGDVFALVDLGRQSFTDSFGHLYAADDLAAFLDTYRAPERFAAQIADPDTAIMVATDGPELAAYCLLHLDRGFEERPEPRPRRPALLSQLYCDSRCTGRGIGAALLDWAIDEARRRGCDALQLSVYSENFGAQRFYGRYGFAKVADIDFWVGRHRDDEFLYELGL